MEKWPVSDLNKMREKVKSLRVLIVDDEEDIRRVTSGFMKKFFDDVDCAENGVMALEMIEVDEPYDIVLTDMQMPKMKGDILAQQIAKIDESVFIAIMTGSPIDDIDSVKNCDMYLPKPIGIDEMFNMIDMLIMKKDL